MNYVVKYAFTLIGLVIDALLISELVLSIREHLNKKSESNQPGQDNTSNGN